MKNLFYMVILNLILLVGCGGGENSSTSTEIVTPPSIVLAQENVEVDANASENSVIHKISIPTRSNDAVESIGLVGEGAEKFRITVDGDIYLRKSSLNTVSKVSNKTTKTLEEYLLQILIIYASGEELKLSILIKVYTYVLTSEVNIAPIAHEQNITLKQNSSVKITLTGNDIEEATLTYKVVKNTAHGQLTGILPNLVYTPKNDYIGKDEFNFRVNDGEKNSKSVTVSLNIEEVLIIDINDSNESTNSDNNNTDNNSTSSSSSNKILMFVAYNGTWWAEYKVIYESLLAAGYVVDVRSSSEGTSLTYGDRVDDTEISLQTPASYESFSTLFKNSFNVTWNSTWNNLDDIELDGRIQDIVNMDDYSALVIPGGYGSQSYRYDGTYEELRPTTGLLSLRHHTILNPETHVESAVNVQSAAEKLNVLISDALSQGKPVLSTCHAAPLLAFARIEGSSGSGFDGLGESILNGKYATGFPLTGTIGGAIGDVALRYADLNVSFLRDEAVVIDGPDEAYSGNAKDKVITVADWYPESAAYGIRTLVSMLESYPRVQSKEKNISVLVFGGNEPTHYARVPANEVDITNLLNVSGEYNITATSTDSEQVVTSSLENYDVLVYFQHNSIAQATQDFIENYVDNGGSALFMHHGIYNHRGANDTLINMVGAELPESARLIDTDIVFEESISNKMLNVDYGHYISSYNVFLNETIDNPLNSYTIPYISSDAHYPNQNLDANGGYYMFEIDAPDELYPGSRFIEDVVFGRDINEINRIFSSNAVIGNGLINDGQYDTWGWTRLYDANLDGKVGKIVYLEPGETNDITFANLQYQQVIRNAIVWASTDSIVKKKPSPIAMSENILMAENSTNYAITLTGTKGDNSPLESETFVILTQPSHGRLSGTAPNLTYTVDVNYTGHDSFTFIIQDGNTESLVSSINIVINETGKKELGVNVGGLRYFTTSLNFLNQFKRSRDWISQTLNPYVFNDERNISTDDNGYVNVLDTNQSVLAILYSSAQTPAGFSCESGRYLFRYEGEGVYRFSGAATIISQDDEAKTAIIEFNCTGTQSIRFNMYETNPQNHMRNFSLVHEDYIALYDNGERFHPRLLDSLKNYSSLRFMDWGQTNFSTVSSWDNRPTIENFSYGVVERGVPVEVMIDLANRLELSPWICVPHLATDEYFSELGRLLKTRLSPNLKFYVEYSNEVWNRQFIQNYYAIEQGALKNLYAQNPVIGGVLFHWEQTSKIGEALAREFSDEVRQRYVVVAGAWNASFFSSYQGFLHLISLGRWEYIDSVALAPYIGGRIGNPDLYDPEEVANLNSDQVLEIVQNNIPTVMNDAQEYIDYFKQFNINVIAYEAGQHLARTRNRDYDDQLDALFIATNRTEGMGQLYSTYLNAWNELNHAALMMMYESVAASSQNGSFGLKEYDAQEHTSKYDAVMQWMEAEEY